MKKEERKGEKEGCVGVWKTRVLDVSRLIEDICMCLIVGVEVEVVLELRVCIMNKKWCTVIDWCTGMYGVYFTCTLN